MLNNFYDEKDDACLTLWKKDFKRLDHLVHATGDENIINFWNDARVSEDMKNSKVFHISWDDYFWDRSLRDVAFVEAYLARKDVSFHFVFYSMFGSNISIIDERENLIGEDGGIPRESCPDMRRKIDSERLYSLIWFGVCLLKL